jgi:trigger factor
MKKTLLSLCLLLCMVFTMVACSSTPYDYNLDDYISFEGGANVYKTLTATQKEIQAYVNQNRYALIETLTTKDANGNAKIGTDHLINKGAAQAGDVVTLTYSGIIAGETEANSACTSTAAINVTIGTDYEGLPAGFDDALVGVVLGEEKTGIVLTYPAEHENETLRDKEVTFTVKVSKIARPNYVPSVVTDKTVALVQLGDKLTLDYSGILEGELTAFQGGTATDTNRWIGSSNLIDGFEDQLLGAPLGVELKLKMTFPQDYPDKTKAGKNVTFTVTVDAIDRPQAELTVALLNENKNAAYATLDEWYSELAQTRKEELAQSKLLAKVKIIAFPKEETTRYAENIVNYYEYIAAYSGYSLSYYAQASGYETLEAFITGSVIPQAQKQVKNEMMLLKVAQLENITVSDDEFNAYLEAHFAENGYDTPKQFRKEAGEENIRLMILCEKTTKYLASIMVVE